MCWLTCNSYLRILIVLLQVVMGTVVGHLPCTFPLVAMMFVLWTTLWGDNMMHSWALTPWRLLQLSMIEWRSKFARIRSWISQRVLTIIVNLSLECTECVARVIDTYYYLLLLFFIRDGSITYRKNIDIWKYRYISDISNWQKIGLIFCHIYRDFTD